MGNDFTTCIVPEVEKIRSLNLPDPQGLLAGKLYLFIVVLHVTLSSRLVDYACDLLRHTRGLASQHSTET
jgi:hypothetical protein